MRHIINKKNIFGDGSIEVTKSILLSSILLFGLMASGFLSIAGFDAMAASASTSVQPTASGTSTSALGPIVQIANVHTLPAVVAKGSDFKIDATVVNHSDKTIRFTRDCSPLTPQAVFSSNNNVIKINQKVCNIFPVLARILPGKSAHIEIPGAFGGIFHATAAGNANFVIVFKYINENDTTTNITHQVKVPFHLTIQGDPSNSIVLDNIKTQPASVHIGDSIRFDATVTNHSVQTIQFVGGPCDSPLSAKFDKNVRTLFTPRCLAIGQPVTLKSNESAHIGGPASGILYKAISSGNTITQVSFSYNTHDSNGTLSPHQVTQVYQFVIAS